MESKYFKREEFECKCGCGFNAVDVELLSVLERARVWFNKPITITSGNRCVQHNLLVGGAANSKHVKGIACDFKVADIHADRVAEYLEESYPNKYGIGRYDERTHLDIRSNIARWDNRIKELR